MFTSTIIEEIKAQERVELARIEWAKFNARHGFSPDAFASKSIYLGVKTPIEGIETLIGYVHLKVGQGVCYIGTAIIAEEFRGEGHAKAFAIAIDMRAREEGCHAVWLKTCALYTEAVSFWESVGFTRVATLPNFELGETWYFYVKEL